MSERPSAVLSALAFGAAIAWVATRRSPGAERVGALRAERDELTAANERLRRANRDILAAQARAEMVTQLVVHDLKNPLTVVLSHVSVAQQAVAAAPELAETAEDLRIAEAEAQRLSAMIGDLLLVSRLEHGGCKLDLARVRVADVLDRVRRGVQPQAAAKHVRVEIAGAADVTATLDASLVRRLVENLVANAFRYTPAGGRIELAVTAEAGDVRLAVRNSGPPVAHALRPRLFGRYSTHGARESHNAGLGLYLCRLVAESHGGDIALVDRPGWNVSFEVVLPARPAEAPRDPGRRAAEALGLARGRR